MNYKNYEKLLKKHKTTTYRVCKETGLDPSMFTKWKKGEYQPKIDKIIKISDHFGVNIEYLL